MEEAKPNYKHWDKEQEFTLIAAAYLMCDFQPRNANKDSPHPFEVIEMIKNMKHGDLEIEVTRSNLSHGRRPSRFARKGENARVSATIKEEKHVTRDALVMWCEQTGRRPRFLYCDERDQPSSYWPFKHDTELLIIVREVIRENWENKDPARAPSKEGIVNELQVKHGLSKNEAEAVDLVTRHDSIRNPRRKQSK